MFPGGAPRFVGSTNREENSKTRQGTKIITASNNDDDEKTLVTKLNNNDDGKNNDGKVNCSGGIPTRGRNSTTTKLQHKKTTITYIYI